MRQIQTSFFVTAFFLLLFVIALNFFQPMPNVSGNIVANQQVSLCSLDNTFNNRLLQNLPLPTGSKIFNIYNMNDNQNRLWGIIVQDSAWNSHLFLYDVGPNGIMADSSDDKVLTHIIAPTTNNYYVPFQVTGYPNPTTFYYLEFDSANQQYIVWSCPIQGCSTQSRQELILSGQKWQTSISSSLFSSISPAFVMESKQRLYVVARDISQGGQGVHFMSCSLIPTSTDACFFGERALKTHYILPNGQYPNSLDYSLSNVGFVYSFWGTGSSPSWLYFDAATDIARSFTPTQIADVQFLQTYGPNPSQFNPFLFILNTINITPKNYVMDFSFFDPVTGQPSPIVKSIADSSRPLDYFTKPHLFFDTNDRLFGAVILRNQLDVNGKKIRSELVLRKPTKKENVLGYNFHITQALYHISDRQIVSFDKRTIPYYPVAISCP